MFEKITQYLDRKGTAYTLSRSGSVAVFLTRMNNAIFNCVIEINEPLSFVVFYSIVGAVVPPDKRAKVSELITRINYNLFISNFEMDFDAGEIRLRSSFDFESIELTDTVLSNLIGGSLSIIDEYFYAIIDTIKSDFSPTEIIRKLDEDKELEEHDRNDHF